jgi:hypothetical protein
VILIKLKFMKKNYLVFSVVIVVLAVVAFFILLQEDVEEVDLQELREPEESEVSLVEDYSEEILGEWRSKDDKKSVVVFSEDGTFKSVYDEEELSSGSWRIEEERGEFDVSFYLYQEVDEEVYEYEITNIDEESLSLIYLDRGNILEYERF